MTHVHKPQMIYRCDLWVEEFITDLSFRALHYNVLGKYVCTCTYMHVRISVLTRPHAQKMRVWTIALHQFVAEELEAHHVTGACRSELQVTTGSRFPVSSAVIVWVCLASLASFCILCTLEDYISGHVTMKVT